MSNCGICNFRGIWDTSYCPLFITLGNIEAKGNIYKKWCKVAESAVGSLRYYICGKEIVLTKKVGRFEMAEMESWMDLKGKPPSPHVMDILDCLKILNDQGEHRIIKTTLEDIIVRDDAFIPGIDDSFVGIRAKITKYAKHMGFFISIKRKKDNAIHIFNKTHKGPRNEPKENALNGEKREGEVDGAKHIGNGEEVQGRAQAKPEEVL